MKIEKLIKSKKVPDRWLIELEGGETLFADIAVIADSGIYEGKELSDEELSSLRAASSAASAKARALRILGARQLSKKEMTDKLLSKGETEKDTAEAVDFLERIGALDDKEYAAVIVRHYAAKGYGGRRIRDELYKRGVPRDLWEDALSEMPEEKSALDSIIASRAKGSMDRKELKKLTDMLMRRGFSWDEIKEALERNRVNADEE